MANKNLGTYTVGLGINATQITSTLTKLDVDTKTFAKKVKGNFNPLNKTFADLRGMIIGAFGISAISGTFQYFDKIDGSLKKMTVGISNARSKTVDFASAAKSLYGSMPMSIEQATDAIQILANKTKLTGQAFSEAAKQAAALAKLTGGNEATGSSLIAMKRWGVDEKDFKKYTDFIYSVSKDAGLGAAGVDKLNKALAETDNTLGAFGFKMEDVARVIAALEADGRSSTDAIGSLNKAVAEMVSTGKAENLSDGWRKMREEIEKADTPMEKIKASMKYFGSKGQAQEMLEVFAVMDEALLNSAVSMSSATDDAAKLVTNMERLNILAKQFTEAMANGIMNALDPWMNLFSGKRTGVDFLDRINGSLASSGSVQLPKGAGGLDIGSGASGDAIKTINLGTITHYTQKVNGLSKSVASLGKNMADYTKAATWTKKTNDELFGNLPSWQTRIEDFGKELKDSITDSFTNIITQTQSLSDAFRNMVSNILTYITKLYVEQNISRPIAGALTNSIGGLFNGGGSVSSLGVDMATSSIPAFADGGAVSSGVPITVGEAGREVFVPSVDGRIIPSAQSNNLGNGSGMTVNQSFTLSAGTPQELEAKMRIMIAKAKTEIASSIADVSRRGGRSSSLIRNGA